MNETTKQLLLALTMALIAVAVGGVAILLLHDAAFEQARQSLTHTAKTQARLMEAVARFDAQHSTSTDPQGAAGATIRQIIDSLRHYEGFGATGEIVVGRRDGDRIVLLHRQRHDDSVPMSLPWDGRAGEPMRRALSGDAGTGIVPDVRGQTVLAAYEPVAGLGIGVVAKINIEEINAPFVRAGLYAGTVALLIIVMGVTLFLRVTNPLVRRLEENEERFRALAEAALEGVMFTDNGRIVEINEAGAALAGSARAALIGRNVLDFCAPADRERVATNIRNNVTEPYEFTALRADGSEFPVVVRGRTSSYHGRAVRVTVFRDLTERRRAEAALRDSAARLRESQRLARLGSWDLDLTHNKLEWSDEVFRIFEIDPDGFGASYDAFLEVIHPDDREAVNRAYTESVRNRAPYDIVHRLRMKDGRIKYVHEHCETFYDVHGQPLRSIGTIQDITGRRQAEEALRESEERFRKVFQSSAALITVSRMRDGLFLEANDAFLRSLGWTREEVIGHTAGEIGVWADPRQRERVLAQLQAEGRIAEVELQTRGRSGAVGLVLASIERIELAGEPCLLIVSQDITGRKRAEQALRDSEAMLVKAEEIGHIGCWAYDLPSNRVTWSDELYRIFGLAPGSRAPSYEMFLDCIHPDDRGRVSAAIAAARASDRSFGYTYRLRRADGSERILQSHAHSYKNEAGIVVRMFGVTQDVTERERAEAALRASEERYRAMFEGASDGIVVADTESMRFTTANRRWTAMLGYEPDEVPRLGVADIHPVDALPLVFELFRQMSVGEIQVAENLPVLRKDGSVFHADISGSFLLIGGKRYLAGFFRDITARRQAEEQMRKLSSALDQAADSVIITDRAGVIEYANPACLKNTGYQREELLGRKPNLLKSGKQGAGFYQNLWQTILAGAVFSDVFINRRKDGSLYYEEKTISPLKDAVGQITHFVSTGKDVTERIQTEERLQYMAQHDALTDLPNRALFLDRLKQALARARWRERLVAVLFVDLDRFKTINDTLGHEAGDRLLQQLAGRFGRCVREGDTVARFGGDEFVILLDDVASDKDIGAVAHKVLDALTPPFEIDGQELYITASIGVSLFPNDGEDASALLKHADIAMYRAKEAGKNTWQMYSADMSARAFERLTLESSLRHALEREEFRLYYQPQVDVESGAIIGVEALLRWQHPDFGLVSPSDFIPLLEETGLIVPVGEWVLHTACAQLRVWHAAGRKDLRMAINLSPRQFHAPGLAQTVERAAAGLNGTPGALEFEITENVILQHAAATHDTLEALRELGARLAIDDFGTGYSSLSYLRRFPIDTVKIDRSFVHDIPDDADDSAITAAIIALAGSLKLEVIAEGVETEAQRDFLRARGCRSMQGYLFNRPLPAEDVTRLLVTPPTR